MRADLFKDVRIRKEIKVSEVFLKGVRGKFKESRLGSPRRIVLSGKESRLLQRDKRSKARVKNLCLLTGRGRGVLRRYGVSRLSVKKLVKKGYFVGLRRSSF